MNQRLIECLKSRLIGCRWCPAILNDGDELAVHLAEQHAGSVCREGVLKEVGERDEDIDRPHRLYICDRDDCGYVKADTESWNALDAIIHHITEEHPNPHGPVRIGFRVSTDTDLIEGWWRRRDSHRFDCLECTETFGTTDAVTEHWVKEHRELAVRVITNDEVRIAVEAEQLRYRTAVASCRVKIAFENYQELTRSVAPDDGYEIRKKPSGPLVRGKPIKDILYIVRHHRPTDDELDAMLAAVGAEFDDEGNLQDGWHGDEVTVHVDLTFCNILFGFIPRVRQVRRILPLLADGKQIEVSWHDATNECFPCTVSRKKQAIYNIHGKLKECFKTPDGKTLDAGTRLYITRIGERKYRLWLRRHPHVVRDCKIFRRDQNGRWRVDIEPVEVEWETSDYVFRHQLTFHELDALFDEARRLGWGVRAAVFEVMKENAQNVPWHVRSVYELVFLKLRTCSLGAVWAEFHKGNTYYQNVGPGFYLFNPEGMFRRKKYVPPPRPPEQRASADTRTTDQGSETKAEERTESEMSQLVGETTAPKPQTEGAAPPANQQHEENQAPVAREPELIAPVGPVEQSRAFGRLVLILGKAVRALRDFFRRIWKA